MKKSFPKEKGGYQGIKAYILREKRDEWWRVVNAGGTIVPGQSFRPSSATKGKYDPDRRLSGRQWANPENTIYDQPGANTKATRRGGNRGRFGFSDWRRYGPKKRF